MILNDCLPLKEKCSKSQYNSLFLHTKNPQHSRFYELNAIIGEPQQTAAEPTEYFINRMLDTSVCFPPH